MHAVFDNTFAEIDDHAGLEGCQPQVRTWTSDKMPYALVAFDTAMTLFFALLQVLQYLGECGAD